MREQLAEIDPEILLIDDCDDALLGYVERCGSPAVACYSYEKLVRCFMVKGMSHEEATEWISFNVAGAYLGEKTPMILYAPTT